MKVLAVVGSLRNGNTKHLVDETIVSMQSKHNVQIDKVLLSNIEMNFCNGCLLCDTTGECIHHDDMSKLVSKAREADAFILATPARWGLLSGEMKTFLDRLNPLAINEELKGKKAVLFAVGQSEEEERDSIVLAAESLKTFCDNAGIEVVNTVTVCGCYDADDVLDKDNYLKACRVAGDQLLDDV